MVHAPFFFLHFTSFFFSTWVGAGGTLRAFLPFSPLISCFLLLLLLVASFLPLILCRKELFAPWLFAKFTQYLSIFQLSNCPIWLLKRSCAFFTYQWLSISQKSLVTPPSGLDTGISVSESHQTLNVNIQGRRCSCQCCQMEYRSAALQASIKLASQSYLSLLI